jgi:biopolymer transport protein ExbB/TolQ
MSKNLKEQKSVKVETVKRKDYLFLVNFIKNIKSLDLESENNKERVKEIYLKSSNNKVFSNIERVIKRSLRVEIKPVLERELKESNLTLQEYKEITYKVINLSRNKTNKFLEVISKE